MSFTVKMMFLCYNVADFYTIVDLILIMTFVCWCAVGSKLLSQTHNQNCTFISLRRQCVIISSFLANLWQFMIKQSLVGNTDIQYQKQVELWILHLFEPTSDFPCDFTYLNNGSVFNELADQIFRRQGAASRQA